ncbi:Coatomer, gamma subunit [Ascobolus immersus RN42]|uniref:Coatomer subunit gamma n=1 Tax=Ascobolus immersus RN42 TaxID=1160509 RepID=A0A3N4I8H5_ASCIM|nr:Coatomer, gamma subunit [Ascobolus immersus RN42]
MISQEARVFNDTPLNVSKCRDVLTKILHTVRSGDHIPEGETTDLFFAVSKLFQHKDPNLRQLVHLIVRELAGITEDVIMITSSVMKDTVGGSELIFRPNAIRNLCRVIDLSTVQAIERSLKTAINDKSHAVASAGIISSYHLYLPATESSRRTLPETQDALSSFGGSSGLGMFGTHSPSSMPQYHALGLLILLKRNDRNGLVKLLQSFQRADLVRNPLGVVLLIRLAGTLIQTDSQLKSPLIAVLKGWADHKTDMISLEALRTLAGLTYSNQDDALAIIKVLSPHLQSPRAVVKIMALRILKLLSKQFPSIVSPFNRDLENSISLGNKVISTLAIAILLQTGSEDSVERLVGQVKTFIPDISDEFRLFIVASVEELALKFPKQTQCIINLLSTILREEGSSAFKERIILSYAKLIQYSPEFRDEILMQLCEFVEDCEYPKLAILVLNILAVESSQTRRTGPFVRYIYNRIVLENSNVRAASVAALSTICQNGGDNDTTFQRSILQLLTQATDDSDDEVRDRAITGISPCLGLGKGWLTPKTDEEFGDLEDHLTGLVRTDSAVDLSDWQPRLASSHLPTKHLETGPVVGTVAARSEAFSSISKLVPMVSTFGRVWTASATEHLTEPEAEYVLEATKYIYAQHIVLHVRVTNTLPDVWLRDASLVSVPALGEALSDHGSLTQVFTTSIDVLGPGESKDLLVGFALEEVLEERGKTSNYPLCKLINTLKFTAAEDVNDNAGYEDDFQVEAVALGLADYFVAEYAHTESWDSGSVSEAQKSFKSTRFRSISDSVAYISSNLGLEAQAVHVQSNQLCFGGKLPFGSYIDVKVRMAPVETGVAFQITARGENKHALDFVVRGFLQMVKW